MYIAEQLFTKSVPSTMKMKVKGGAAVDPDSGNKPKIDVYCFVNVQCILNLHSIFEFTIFWGSFSRNGGHCPYCSEEWRNFQCCSWFGGCCQGNKLFLQTASPGKR